MSPLLPIFIMTLDLFARMPLFHNEFPRDVFAKETLETIGFLLNTLSLDVSLFLELIGDTAAPENANYV